MVSVKLYYSPGCPKCDGLIEELSKASAEIGFEFEPVLVDTSSEIFYTRDPASKTYSKDWFDTFGTEKQKKLYEEAAQIIEFLGSSTAVPALEITWFHGGKNRTIVIKGFSKEHGEKGIANVISAIRLLIMLEKRATSIIGLKNLKGLIK
jgi:thiol-disulfide isomerase/thioredoxin